MALSSWAYFLATASFVTFVLLHRYLTRGSSKKAGSPVLAAHGKTTTRTPGGNYFLRQYSRPTDTHAVWPPSPFKPPRATPYPGWSVETTRPLLYRPFRHGPRYFVTMGLRKMAFDEWIELDNEFLGFHAQKAARLAERAEKCCYTRPDAFPAACELLEELAEFLPARYPALFRRTAVGLDNVVTGESFNIVRRPLAEDPLATAARWIQDDLAIMTEGADGQYYLTAGAVLLGGFWRLQDKLGMSLDEIHLSGDVPHFRQKLQAGMNNFFARIQPEAPMVRNNYFIQVDGELPWSSSIGSEDAPQGEFGWFSTCANKPIEDIYFRSERQTLRRLPKSGGVVCCPTPPSPFGTRASS